MYIPVKQRGSTATKTSGYVPVAQRKQKVSPKKELYKTADGQVMNKEQFISALNQQEKPKFSLGKGLLDISDKVTNIGVGLGQVLFRGGAHIGATYLQADKSRGGKVGPDEFEVGSIGRDLLGLEEGEKLKSMFGLRREGKAVLPEEKYGKVGVEVIATAASLAPFLDLVGGGGEKKVISELAKTKDIG